MAEEVQALLREAEAAHSQREWDLAIEKYKAVLELDPQHEESCSKLAELYALRGLISDVIDQYFTLMDILEQKDEFELSVEVARWIIKLQPENDKARMKTILIYKKKGDMDEVVKQSLQLARLYIELGQGDQSIQLLQGAQEIAPENLDIGLELAEMYISHGHIQEGTNQYRKIANAYLTKGQMDKAAEAFRRMKVVVPEDPQLMFTLGNLYLNLGRYNEAEAEFRAILRHDLNHTEALMSLGLVCQKKGQFRDAILAFNKILSVNPQNEIAREKLGELYHAQGATSEAVKNYLAAANTYQYEDQVDRAIKLYQRVLSIDPTNPTATRELTNLGAPLESEDGDTLEDVKVDVPLVDMDGEIPIKGGSLDELAGIKDPGGVPDADFPDGEMGQPSAGAAAPVTGSVPSAFQNSNVGLDSFKRDVGSDLEFGVGQQSDIVMDEDLQEEAEPEEEEEEEVEESPHRARKFGKNLKKKSGGRKGGGLLRKGLSSKRTMGGAKTGLKPSGGLLKSSGKTLKKKGLLSKGKPAGGLFSRRKGQKTEVEPAEVEVEVTPLGDDEYNEVPEPEAIEPEQADEMYDDYGEQTQLIDEQSMMDEEVPYDEQMEEPLEEIEQDFPEQFQEEYPQEEYPQDDFPQDMMEEPEIPEAMGVFPQDADIPEAEIPDWGAVEPEMPEEPFPMADDSLGEFAQEPDMALEPEAALLPEQEEAEESEEEEDSEKPFGRKKSKGLKSLLKKKKKKLSKKGRKKKSEEEEAVAVALEEPEIEMPSDEMEVPELLEPQDIEAPLPVDDVEIPMGLDDDFEAPLPLDEDFEAPMSLDDVETSVDDTPLMPGMGDDMDVPDMAELPDFGDEGEFPSLDDDTQISELPDIPDMDLGMGVEEELPEMTDFPPAEISEADVPDLGDEGALDISTGIEEPPVEMDIPELELSENEIAQSLEGLGEVSEDIPEMPAMPEESQPFSVEMPTEEDDGGISLSAMGSVPSEDMLSGSFLDEGSMDLEIPDLMAPDSSDDLGGLFGSGDSGGDGFLDLLKLAEEIEDLTPNEDRIREIEEAKKEKALEEETVTSEDGGEKEEESLELAASTSMLPDLGDLEEKEEDSEEKAHDTETTEIPDLPSAATTSFLPVLEMPDEEPVPEAVEEKVEEKEEIPEPIEETPAAPVVVEVDLEEKIRNLLNESDYGKAFPLFEEALSKNPENVELMREFADLTYNYGLIDKALNSYKTLLDKEPHNHEVRKKVIKGQLIYNYVDDAVVSLLEYGNTLTAEDRIDEAQRIYQHVLALDRENSRAREAVSEIYLNQDMKQLALFHLNILAEYLEKQKAIDDTIRILKKIFSLTSDILTQEKLAKVYIDHDYKDEAADELWNLAERYLEMEENMKASIHYQKIVEMQPEHIEAHKRLIDLYNKLGDRESSYREKVTVAELHLAKGQKDLARKGYEECLQIRDYDNDVRRKLVDIYLDLGDSDSALKETQVLSGVYLKERRYDEAVELYLKLIDAVPGNLALREKVSEFYVLSNQLNKGMDELVIVAEKQLELEEWDNAIKTFKKALTIDDKKADIHYKIGEIYLDKINNKTEARYEFDKVYELDPKHKKAMEHLVHLYLGEDKPAKAINVLLELIKIDPSYTEMRDRIIEDFKKKIEDDSQDYRSQFSLGIIYKELKMWKQAIERFQITRRSDDYVLESHNMLGISFSQQPPMLSLAIKTLEKGIQLKGHKPEEYVDLHYNLGKLYMQTKKYKKAVDEFQAVMAIDSHYRDIVELLKDAKASVK